MADIYEAEGLKWTLLDRLLFLESLGRLDHDGGDPRFSMEKWIPVPHLSRDTRDGVPRLETALADKPVTVQEFARFLEADDFSNPALWDRMPPGILKQRESLRARYQIQRRHPNWPVVKVGVGEAIAFCRWRTRRRADGKIVRLPTSSEWRDLLGRRPHRYWSGKTHVNPDNPPVNLAGAQLQHPSPIGAFAPDSTGIFDAIGNVWEWCIHTHATTKRRTPRRSFWVFGGSFHVDPKAWQLEEPFTTPPPSFEYTGEESIGFRCALTNYEIELSSLDFSREFRPERLRSIGRPPNRGEASEETSPLATT